MSTDVDGFSFKLDGAQWLNNVYNTPVVLARLGEHGLCDLPGACSLPIQLANSSDMKAHGTLSSFFRQPHLKTWITTKVEQCPQIRPLIFSWCPPGMPRIVMCATRGDKVLYQQLYASNGVDLLHQEQCSWAQPKVGWSCGDGSWKK